MVAWAESTLGILLVAISTYYIFDELQSLRRELDTVKSSISDQSVEIRRMIRILYQMQDNLKETTEKIHQSVLVVNETPTSMDEDERTIPETISKGETDRRHHAKKYFETDGVPHNALLIPLSSSLVVKSLILHCADLQFKEADEMNTSCFHASDNPTDDSRKTSYRFYDGESVLPLHEHPLYWEMAANIELLRLLKEGEIILKLDFCSDECNIEKRPKQDRNERTDVSTQTLTEKEDKNVKSGLKQDAYDGFKISLNLQNTNDMIRWSGMDGDGAIHRFDTDITNRLGAASHVHYGIVFDHFRQKVVFLNVHNVKESIVITLPDYDNCLRTSICVNYEDILTEDITILTGRDIDMSTEKKHAILNSLTRL